MSQIDSPDEEGEFTASTEWVAFDEDEEVYRVAYDPAIDETSLAVVSAVATVSGTDPIDLEPLHDAVDTSALDRLFQPEDGPRNCRMAFRFREFDVTVDSTGVIEVKRG